MNPKKPLDEKAKNSGISLPPEVKERATELAKQNNFRSLSAYVFSLLSEKIDEAADSMKEKSEKLKKSGRAKIKAAREK